MRTVFLSFVLGVLAQPNAWPASPCDGVDRSLTEQRKAALTRAIAARFEEVEVLESFRFGGWTILAVQPQSTDEAFFFYSHDPMASRAIAMWAGAAAYFEGPSVERWTLKNAAGIPTRLASCFAWHVTKDRVGRGDAPAAKP